MRRARVEKRAPLSFSSSFRLALRPHICLFFLLLLSVPRGAPPCLRPLIFFAPPRVLFARKTHGSGDDDGDYGVFGATYFASLAFTELFTATRFSARVFPVTFFCNLSRHWCRWWCVHMTVQHLPDDFTVFIRV